MHFGHMRWWWKIVHKMLYQLVGNREHFKDFLQTQFYNGFFGFPNILPKKYIIFIPQININEKIIWIQRESNPSWLFRISYSRDANRFAQKTYKCLDSVIIFVKVVYYTTHTYTFFWQYICKNFYKTTLLLFVHQKYIKRW